LIDAMAKQKTVASISGYHSAAGTLTANQELAKQRAFSVRDALAGGGCRRNPRQAARSRCRPRPTWRAKTPLRAASK
jgi:outer membrane protein OmpA-like peptidoglycan-associated protein